MIILVISGYICRWVWLTDVIFLLYSMFACYYQCVQTAGLIFSHAAALFQSTERLLIDVKSIRVPTNEMEEILKLLTECDIEHTNNLPLRSSSYLYLYRPFPRITPLLWSLYQYLSASKSLSSYIHHMSLFKSAMLPYIQKPRGFQPVYTSLTY